MWTARTTVAQKEVRREEGELGDGEAGLREEEKEYSGKWQMNAGEQSL